MTAMTSRWVAFALQPAVSAKTKRWTVTGTGGDDDVIGIIHWSGNWRQYVFRSNEAVYNPECLRDIAAFVAAATTEHAAGLRAARLARSTVEMR